MPYTIQGKVKYIQQLTSAEEKKWDAFVNNLRTMAPAEAAKAAGDSDYKKLKGSNNQWELRLSGSKRATFVLDGTSLRQVQVGGHT